MALHQRGRDQALAEQALRAVHVGHDGVEHAHALGDADLDLRPFVGRHEQREQVDRPGALEVGFVGVDVVSDAVLADLPRQARLALAQLGEAAFADAGEK